MSEAEGERKPEAGSPGHAGDSLGESLRDLGASGRASLGAAADAAKALRSLIAADLSLARSALGRALAYVAVAIAFGVSSWLLLVATLVTLLSALGLSWFAAMLIGATISLAVTGFAGWQAMRYFEHTSLEATRRQLARLGIGELADDMPSPGSAQTARAVHNGDEPKAS